MFYPKCRQKLFFCHQRQNTILSSSTSSSSWSPLVLSSSSLSSSLSSSQYFASNYAGNVLYAKTRILSGFLSSNVFIISDCRDTIPIFATIFFITQLNNLLIELLLLLLVDFWELLSIQNQVPNIQPWDQVWTERAHHQMTLSSVSIFYDKHRLKQS